MRYMKQSQRPFLSIAIAACGLVAIGGCDVDQTKEGELPDVDISVTEGQLPAYEIETAEITVDTEEVKVKVPDVDVSMEEKTVTVPDISIDMPED